MGGGLVLSGASGAYASTPDAAALDVVGDIDLRFDGALTSWASGAAQAMVGKWNTGANQRSYLLEVGATGLLVMNWSANGTAALASSSTVPVTGLVAAAGRLAVRAVLDVDNGAAGNTVTFYTAPTAAGPWTQLGASVTTGGTTSIFSGTAIGEVGSFNTGTSDMLAGTVVAAEVRNGIDGAVVANPKFWQPASGAASFTDGAGRVWTMNGTAAVVHGTPSYGLPFQIAADSPCGAADSWCALRDLVAAQMQVNADVIARIDPARPCAIVAMNTPVTIPALSPSASMLPVKFDTIEFDNDRMVDFDRSVQFVRPSRAGIYEVVGWASIGAGTPLEEIQFSVMTGPSGPDLLSPTSGHSSSFAVDSNLVASSPMWLKTGVLDAFDAVDVADVRQFGYGLLIDGGTTVAITLNAVRLAVYWRRDAP